MRLQQQHPLRAQSGWWLLLAILTWIATATAFTTNEQNRSTMFRARSAATKASNNTASANLRRAIGRSATSRRRHAKASTKARTIPHNHQLSRADTNGGSTKSAMEIPGQYIVTFHNDATKTANATILKVLGDARDYLMTAQQQAALKAGNFTTPPLQADDMAEIEWIYHSPALSGATVSGVWSTPLLAYLQEHERVESVEPVRSVCVLCCACVCCFFDSHVQKDGRVGWISVRASRARSGCPRL
jgi:hypothetical protein